MKEENELYSLAPLGYPNYSITIDGKVWTHHFDRYLKSWDCRGYRVIGLSNEFGKKKFTAHRLVAMMFIPNVNGYPAVNHRDGVKSNNHCSNLEWVSYKDNSNHAVQIGLISNILSSNEVKEICEFCKDKKGFTIKEISEEFNLDRDIIGPILQKVSFPHITKGYEFDLKITRRNPLLSESCVKDICEKICEGLSVKEISQMLNINKSTVSRIKRGKRYREISMNFDFDTSRSFNKPLSEIKVRQVCARMHIGLRNIDISRELEISPSIINQIRLKKSFREISKGYDI